MRRGKASQIALDHLHPGEQVMAERHRLGALHVRVPGHQRLGFCLGAVEQHIGEPPDPVARFLTGLLHVEPHRRDDLVVS